jgi:hypothetical protein
MYCGQEGREKNVENVPHGHLYHVLPKDRMWSVPETLMKIIQSTIRMLHNTTALQTVLKDLKKTLHEHTGKWQQTHSRIATNTPPAGAGMALLKNSENLGGMSF